VVGAKFCCTVGAAFVVVHGVTVRCAAVKRVHETAGPLAVGTSWAASHQEWFRAPVFADVDGELPVQIGIDFGPHVAAATPVFIADAPIDRKSTRLNSSHQIISYAVFCLKKKKLDSFA